MKTRLRYSLAALLILAFSLSLRAQDEPKSYGFKLYISTDRFCFQEDEPVFLNLCVRNNPYEKESFRVYDGEYLTFQPVVYESRGTEAETLVPYRLRNQDVRSVIKGVMARTIELAPDETISRKVDLRKLYRLEVGREYRVKGFFFPDLENSVAVPSQNVIKFKIVRSQHYVPVSPFSYGGERVKRRSGIVKPREGITPRETVMLFLTAEKEKDWDNYEKYIIRESYIGAYSDYVDLYNRADDVEKLKILDDFIKFLRRDRPDYIVDFKVLRESILTDRNTAYVRAVVKRYGPRYSFRYEYKYTLEKHGENWKITDVDAIVAKGGKP